MTNYVRSIKSSVFYRLKSTRYRAFLSIVKKIAKKAKFFKKTVKKSLTALKIFVIIITLCNKRVETESYLNSFFGEKIISADYCGG